MRSTSTLVAAGMLFAASTVSAQVYGVDVTKGCYSAVDNYVFNTTYIYNTDGYCQKQCAPLGYNAMATTKGTDCWCGQAIPDASVKVEDALCNTKCAGFGDKMCGGAKYWTVYTSGLVDDSLVSTAGSASSTAAGTSSTTPSATLSSAPSVVTVGGQTVVVTAGSATSNTPSASATHTSSKGGPNKAAIAAGVVVGIVAIASIAGGAFLFIRNKKRREVEEEYRRNAAVSSFIANGGKPPNSSGGASSFNDTRLDPVMAQRRMSDGSIADNQDYSRRILKVTNA